MTRRKKKSRGDLVADQLPLWDRTPFHPQARARGAGCDCKGLLWGVTEELGFPEAQSEYAKATDYNLGRDVPSDRLKEGFAALFDRVTDMKRGDILLCKLGGRAAHIAIYAGDGRAWHANPKTGVRCRRLEPLLEAFPLDSIWRWRDI